MTPQLRQAVKTAAQKPLMSNREADAIIRAVLEGVREPSEEMARSAQATGMGVVTPEARKEMFRAMIDALLASEEG